MLLFNFLITTAIAAGAALPPRLSRTSQDLSTTQRIYLAKGLATVLELPRSVTEVRVGNPKVAKVQLSQVSPKEISLFLTSMSEGPTNMIVRAENKMYVFDLIPSRSTHQDYVKVSSSFGAPKTLGEESEIQSSNPRTFRSEGKLLERVRLEVGP